MGLPEYTGVKQEVDAFGRHDQYDRHPKNERKYKYELVPIVFVFLHCFLLKNFKISVCSGCVFVPSKVAKNSGFLFLSANQLKALINTNNDITLTVKHRGREISATNRTDRSAEGTLPS